MKKNKTGRKARLARRAKKLAGAERQKTNIKKAFLVIMNTDTHSSEKWKNMKKMDGNL